VDRRLCERRGRDAEGQDPLRRSHRVGANPLGHPHIGFPRRPAGNQARRRNLARRRLRRRGGVVEFDVVPRERVCAGERSMAGARHRTGRHEGYVCREAGSAPRR
jgi:hypothetical protein